MHARFVIGRIFYRWLSALPILPAPNARPMIDNGESGSPIFFFFFQADVLQRLQPFYSARARWLRKRSGAGARARVAYALSVCVCVYASLGFVLLWLAGLIKRRFTEKSVYIRGFWIIPRFSGREERSRDLQARLCGKRDPTRWQGELRRSIATFSRILHHRFAGLLFVSLVRAAHIARFETLVGLDLVTSLSLHAALWFNARCLFPTMHELFFFPRTAFFYDVSFVMASTPREFVFSNIILVK